MMGFADCWRRGYFDVNGSLANGDGVLPDTYLNVGNYGWAKGVAFINGFNLVLLLFTCSVPLQPEPRIRSPLH